MKKRIIPPGANQTKESYNLTAEKFKKRFENYQPYRKSVEKFISFLPRECHILDVGCGPGINAKCFLKHNHKVTGIDYSTEMIKIAKEDCPGGTFLVADLNDINLKAKYDAIYASFIIVHLSDEETNQFLEKLPNLLTGDKPKLYLSFMCGKTPGYEKTTFSEYPIFYNYYDKKVIKNKLEKLGFKVLSKDEQLYKERDGSITTDIFLILEYAGKSPVARN